MKYISKNYLKDHDNKNTDLTSVNLKWWPFATQQKANACVWFHQLVVWLLGYTPINGYYPDSPNGYRLASPKQFYRAIVTVLDLKKDKKFIEYGYNDSLKELEQQRLKQLTEMMFNHYTHDVMDNVEAFDSDEEAKAVNDYLEQFIPIKVDNGKNVKYN